MHKQNCIPRSVIVVFIMLCVHVVDGDDEKSGSVWNPVASPPVAQAPPTAQSPQTPASQLLLQRLQDITTTR